MMRRLCPGVLAVCSDVSAGHAANGFADSAVEYLKTTWRF